MIRKITKERPLKVLGFTDTHLDGNEGCYHLSLKLIKETIETEAPDLVVFVGDNVTGGDNRGRAEELTEVMTSLKTPWAPVLGNHEGDNPASILREEMVRIFQQSPYCLIPQEKAVLADGTAVWGNTNYTVALYNEDGDVCHRLIFLDGGSDMSREDMEKFGWGDIAKGIDDYLKESQIAWYKEQVREDRCPSMAFCHIPLQEYRDAYEKGELLAGDNREGVCCSRHNSGMFDAMLEAGKTVAFVAGHDHINDSRILYKGIQLIYNRMSGLSSYNIISKKLGTKLLQGCSVYYIDSAGQVSFDDIFYEDRYPQYHDDIYAVIRK